MAAASSASASTPAATATHSGEHGFALFVFHLRDRSTVPYEAAHCSSSLVRLRCLCHAAFFSCRAIQSGIAPRLLRESISSYSFW